MKVIRMDSTLIKFGKDLCKEGVIFVGPHLQ